MRSCVIYLRLGLEAIASSQNPWTSARKRFFGNVSAVQELRANGCGKTLCPDSFLGSIKEHFSV